MPLITIGFGVLLMVISIGTYVMADEAGFGALLPAILGLLILGCGAGSIVKKEQRKNLMHVAVLLATVGILVPLIGIILFIAELNKNEALELVRIVLVTLACGAYLYFAIQSFITARKARSGKSASGLDSGGDES